MQIELTNFFVSQVIPEIYVKKKFQKQLDVFFCNLLYHNLTIDAIISIFDCICRNKGRYWACNQCVEYYEVIFAVMYYWLGHRDCIPKYPCTHIWGLKNRRLRDSDYCALLEKDQKILTETM